MKSCVEDFAALVRNHEALLKRLLRETRMLSKPIDLADLVREMLCHPEEGACYRGPNLHDLPYHAVH